MPRFSAPVRRPRLSYIVWLTAALIVAALAPTPAFSRSPSFHVAQAAPAQPSDSATSTPSDDEKSKKDKASVPATVVDNQQLESVLGIRAFSAAGEDMGRVVDVIVDHAGEVRAAIIDFGGFLGVGSRQIAVDWRSLRFEPNGKAGTVVVNLTRDQLRVAPVYKSGEPVVVVGGPGVKP